MSSGKVEKDNLLSLSSPALAVPSPPPPVLRFFEATQEEQK